MTLPEAYAAAPALFLAGVFILGLTVGSFLNVVIYRLPEMMHRAWRQEAEEYLHSVQAAGANPKASAVTAANDADVSATKRERFNLATPNSRCPSCGTAIKAWQNIPVVSYLFLKGRCAQCGVHISLRYPLVEAANGVLSLLVVLMLGASTQGAIGLVLLWSLVALTMIDVDHHLLPDAITLPLLWLGLLANLFGVYTDLTSAVIGAMAGYLSLWSVYWVFKLVTGKEGMGFGDFKLLGALGAWMGWQVLPLIVVLSSLVGAILGVGMILLMGRDKAQPMPFGPYLAIAGFIAFLWGDTLLSNYLQLFQLAPPGV